MSRNRRITTMPLYGAALLMAAGPALAQSTLPADGIIDAALQAHDATLDQHARTAPVDQTMGDLTHNAPQFSTAPVLTTSAPALARYEAAEFMNGNFEDGMNGWQWEFTSYAWPEGQFEATGTASVRVVEPADDAAGTVGDGQLEMITMAQAEVVDTTTPLAGGESYLDVYQSFPYVGPDHATLALRRAFASLHAMAAFDYHVSMGAGAELVARTVLFLENTRTQRSTQVELSGVRLIGPCAGVLELDGVHPWAARSLSAADLDLQDGDIVTVRLRYSLEASLSGPGSSLSVAARSSVDDVGVLIDEALCEGGAVNLVD